MAPAPSPPMFDAAALAVRLRKAVSADRLSYRKAAEAADVSLTGFTRAIHGHPHTSCETVMRLQRWLDGLDEGGQDGRRGS